MTRLALHEQEEDKAQFSAFEHAASPASSSVTLLGAATNAATAVSLKSLAPHGAGCARVCCFAPKAMSVVVFHDRYKIYLNSIVSISFGFFPRPANHQHIESLDAGLFSFALSCLTQDPVTEITDEGRVGL